MNGMQESMATIIHSTTTFALPDSHPTVDAIAPLDISETFLFSMLRKGNTFILFADDISRWHEMQAVAMPMQKSDNRNIWAPRQHVKEKTTEYLRGLRHGPRSFAHRVCRASDGSVTASCAGIAKTEWP